METIIQNKLSEALKPLFLEVVDESHKHAGHAAARPGGKSHFKVTIVSEAFTPLSLIARHRLVHTILEDELKGQIHALSLVLRSPEDVP
ncbi:MAG: BolA family transcriptional regulator [Alphaproteobacteria bacterium]|jgi:BolA protein|nr:BolA family transcriptional regulator [Alphaproteobacteria bacterium]